MRKETRIPMSLDASPYVIAEVKKKAMGAGDWDEYLKERFW